MHTKAHLRTPGGRIAWAALALSLAPLAAPAALAAPAVELSKVGVSHPPHLTAADQHLAPGLHAPVRAFDGDPATHWALPPAATSEPGYAVSVEFKTPIPIDALRLIAVPGAPAAPGSAARAGKGAAPPKPARLTRVEIGFFDRGISAQVPVYKRTLAIPADRPTADLGLSPPLRWNAALIEDESAGEKRRQRGLGDEIPFPLNIDGLSVTVVEMEPGEAPPTLAEVSVALNGQTYAPQGVEAIAKRGVAYIEAGIRHILEGRYLVGPERTLAFDAGGGLFAIAAADWQAGKLDGRARKRLGDWRVAQARLEFKPAGGRFEPVAYALDDAPRSVTLGPSALAGEYAVSSRAPEAAAAPKAPPTGGKKPQDDAPPLLE